MALKHLGALADRVQPRILSRARGALFVDKPSGLCLGSGGASSSSTWPPRAEARLHFNELDGGAPQAIFGSQHEVSTTGVAFFAMTRRAAAEAQEHWQAQRAEELYTAVVRGRFRLGDVVKVNARLCRPSEGSTAWRLAGSRREGSEAFTLMRGLAHGYYGGELCTILEMRPVTSLVQQLRLHCVALGHPIVGDDVHDADRRLDFRFQAPLASTRLMLHCQHIRVPFADGDLEAVAPDPLRELLQPTSESCGSIGAVAEVDTDRRIVSGLGSSPLMGKAAVAGHSRRLSAKSTWEDFAGGLNDRIDFDDTHLDVPIKVRKFKGPPYGPPEWDDRARLRRSRGRSKGGVGLTPVESLLASRQV